MDFYEISILLLWVAFIIQSVFIFYISKFVASFLKNIRVTGSKLSGEEMAIGEKIPMFRELDHLQREVKTNEKSGKFTLLVFASNKCMYCKEIVSSLLSISRSFNLRIIIVSKEKLDVNRSEELHFIQSKTLFENYKIKSVPTILLVDNKNYLVSNMNVYDSHSLTINLEHYFLNKTRAI